MATWTALAECALRASSRRATSLRVCGVLVRDLALGDLFERHRQVVLRARLDQRRRQLVEADALAELVVVVVDLPGTLGGHDHERVARVDVLEQLVDARIDHWPDMVPAARAPARRWPASSSTARSTSSFRTTYRTRCACSSWLARRARSARRSRPSISVARSRSRRSSSLDRRGDEDRHARRHLLLHRERAFRLELEHAPPPCRRDPLDLGAQRPVALAGDVRRRARGSRRRRRAATNSRVVEEVVLAPVVLARPPRARRRRDGDLELGDALDEQRGSACPCRRRTAR